MSNTHTRSQMHSNFIYGIVVVSNINPVGNSGSLKLLVSTFKWKYLKGYPVALKLFWALSVGEIHLVKNMFITKHS